MALRLKFPRLLQRVGAFHPLDLTAHSHWRYQTVVWKSPHAKCGDSKVMKFRVTGNDNAGEQILPLQRKYVRWGFALEFAMGKHAVDWKYGK